jgi:hypothetical protein
MEFTGRGKSFILTAAGILLPLAAIPQGVSTGNVAALPKPKFSGIPFTSTFSDVAREAGLTMRFVNGRPDRKRYIIEATGTGVAFTDFDNDGHADIFLVNSSRFERFDNASHPVSHLYRNTGEGKFTDVTRASGLGRSGWGNGVCTGDVDNDGYGDLYVTYWGPNSLFRNTGENTFEDIAAVSGVAGPKEEWSTGCTFVDYDRDGHLDLFVASYVAFDARTTPDPGQFPYCMFRDVPVYCGPRGLRHGTITLYHNRGDGTFEDVSGRSNVRESQPCYAFTAVSADLDGDGWQDIYVACDSTPSLYFRNNRNGTFTELGTEAAIAYNEHGTEQAGMGVVVADFDNDGWLDLTKTNFIRDYPNLYRNLGKGRFEDVVLSAGLGVNPQYVLWGTGLEDLDNDGWRDIIQVSGHVYTNVPGEPWSGPRLVYRNLGDRKFEDVSHLAGTGIAQNRSSRGLAFSDFDNDGDIDAVVMNMDDIPSLLRNDRKNDNNWVGVRLRGTTSNRAAIGASIAVHAAGTTQTAPIVSQSSYLSASDLRVHFGLGRAASIDRITVRWPSGASESFSGVKINSTALLVEGQGSR